MERFKNLEKVMLSNHKGEVLSLSELNWKAILEAAVKVEEQSIALYTMALENAKYPSSKVFLKQLVDEERGHKKKL